MVAVVLLVGVVGFFVFPIFAQAEVYSGPGVRGSVHSVGQQISIYARKNDGRFPDAATWMDDLGWHDKTAGDVLRGPKSQKKEFGVAFFQPLSGLRPESIKNPETVPLVFLSTLNGRNANSNLETLAWLGNEKKYTWVCFVDGHVERMPHEWRLETIVLEVGE
jgi:hypothetical protein